MTTIKPGDRVSWQYDETVAPGYPRQFGKVIYRKRLDYYIEGDNKVRYTIPARFITKEVG